MAFDNTPKNPYAGKQVRFSFTFSVKKYYEVEKWEHHYATREVISALNHLDYGKE